MSDGDRDTGFCSAGDEEDYLEEEGVHSPTDSSEDSVEVKVSPITLLRNKRKCAEPRKAAFSGPLKKRMCLQVAAAQNPEPFRPWSSAGFKGEGPVPKPATEAALKPSDLAEPCSSYFRPPSPPSKGPKGEPCGAPVALLKKNPADLREDPEPLVKAEPEPETLRVPLHPQVATLSAAETERLILSSVEAFPHLEQEAPLALGKGEPRTLFHQAQQLQNVAGGSRKEQRNYKNMTRERRIEANARERTRVHTISAAFDTLRRSIPSYSHNQKLSKLSVLRIACAYIMTLSSLVDDDDGDGERPSTSECVEIVTRTIQREGKLRKKKEDGD